MKGFWYCLAVLASCLATRVLATRVEAADLSVHLAPGPHLFIDDHLIADQSGLTRTITPPKRLLDPIVTGKEDGKFQPYVTVLRDPDTGRFRMWYGIPENASQTHLAYMESEDAIHWIRPHRVLADPARIQFGTSIIDDGADYPDSSNRYKWGWWDEGGLKVAGSPDGLTWTLLAPDVVLRHNHDITSIFHDQVRNRYLALVSSYREGKTWTGKRRVPMQSVSEDLIHWHEPWPVISPDEKDVGETQFYCMGGLIARGDLLIGMLRVLRDDLPADPDGPVAGIGYTVVAWSRDGEHWQRDRQPFLDRNHESGTWDHAMAWADCQVIVGDDTFIYYGGYAQGHKINRFTERQIGLARMSLDRYVARQAGDLRGRLVTPPFVLAAGGMTVNARVEGEMQIRVLDRAGRPLPGFDWADGEPVRGDSIRHAVGWKSDLALLRDKTVRLEFTLRKAGLYGFELRR